MTASTSSGQPAKETPVVAAQSASAGLAGAVKDRLDQGDSLDQIVAQLASALAGKVATQLGLPLEVAREQLTSAFKKALGSSATGPPETNAERAVALVTRFRQIAELATRVTKDEPGQPIRSIAGTSLDAATAKANPTPSATDDILREAQNALAAAASPAAPATPPLTASAASGDGRIVATSASAIAAGGDTLLGRILTRAMQADPQRTAPAVAADDAKPATTEATAAVAPAASPSSTTTQALDAFVRAFNGALARADAETAASKEATTASAPASAASSAAQSPAFAAAFAPVQHDATPALPPSPAPSTPAAQPADPNAIVDQLLRGVAVHVADGSSEVRLRLVPEQLGDLSVKLVVAGGAVDASITAHSADAQSALAGAQSQLAKTLADAGLKLQSFTVALAGGSADARDQSNPQPQTRPQALRRIGGVDATGADEADDRALLAAPSFGPPIYAAAPGALDYLV